MRLAALFAEAGARRRTSPGLGAALFIGAVARESRVVRRGGTRTGKGYKLYSFLTTEPNGVVEPIHNKAMRVMLITPEDAE